MSSTPTDPQQRDPRVYLAGERTFLAWIRTGLAMMGFGFVVARLGLFLRELAVVEAKPRDGTSLSMWVGMALVLLGAALTGASGVRHLRFTQRFQRGEPFRVSNTILLVILAGVLAALGVGLALHLLTVPGR